MKDDDESTSKYKRSFPETIAGLRYTYAIAIFQMWREAIQGKKQVPLAFLPLEYPQIFDPTVLVELEEAADYVEELAEAKKLVFLDAYRAKKQKLLAGELI